MSCEAFLDFVVSKTDIKPDYMNNPIELKKISSMLAEVKNDTAITIRGISVIGYASPEGSVLLTNSFPKDVQRHLLITFSLVSLSLKNYTRWNMVAKTGKDYVKWLQGLTWQKRMEFFIL